MKSVSEPAMPRVGVPPARRRAVLVAAVAVWLYMPNRALALVNKARAAIKTVAPFDAATWASLLRQGPRPAAYVFTTTYCSTCPDAFDKLHAAVVASRQQVELAAVVMDVQGEHALTHARHYQGATRIYAFDGFEPEIRQAVDPKWRNVTPYVVLIGRSGTVQRTIGPPDAAMLKAWLS
ncbi:hypothetical protein [Rhodoferax sp.]|uniref:hypothetical protein n=1 Tax=Rhodoferax sp. TaxID=50421 RepID=UPI00271BEF92|nr:hypothetical protein [Rhodoferax sp.]MDO9196760.1 hypothetical protein [Rhodoferax sp.]